MSATGAATRMRATKWWLITFASTVMAMLGLGELGVWLARIRPNVIAQIAMGVATIVGALAVATLAERRVYRRAARADERREREVAETAEWGVRGATGYTTPFVSEAVARLHAVYGRPLMNRAPGGEWQEVAIKGDPYWDWERS